ncbi:thioesterase II family protein [Aquimarina sp. RZ0]|uniref:thioesterase II family protein n=1 Tax=Aquimarina sp. RZ0 TaxID=2607730 RepID=UPI0011F34D22|nr:thioesterase domain-containing protein [Aquimarina sp. RZ0]KAA1244365.1 thioesterase [Aquimarina sp. RZ0]
MNTDFSKNKIIAIPFAGGNKYSFKTLEDQVPDHLDWRTLELPGRGARFNEESLFTIPEMVEDLIAQLIPHIKTGDYILYGHSMGTLLGYELTKQIIQRKLKLPHCLFFTGRAAPSILLKEKKSVLPKIIFWEKVQEMGGLPKEILKCEELLELYYPILVSDFKAIEDYIYTPMEKPFSIPIYVCLGKDEIGEEKGKTKITDIKVWGDETIFPCTPELMEGDHFFIFRNQKKIVDKLSNIFRIHSNSIVLKKK